MSLNERQLDTSDFKMRLVEEERKLGTLERREFQENYKRASDSSRALVAPSVYYATK